MSTNWLTSLVGSISPWRMEQKITGFHLDAENHWVADLECGHKQHVRHDPPFVQRPWVISESGRRENLGRKLDCKRCDEAGESVARAVRRACIAAVNEAYLEAGQSGLCGEGQLDLALDRLRSMDLTVIYRRALSAGEAESES